MNFASILLSRRIAAFRRNEFWSASKEFAHLRKQYRTGVLRDISSVNALHWMLVKNRAKPQLRTILSTAQDSISIKIEESVALCDLQPNVICQRFSNRHYGILIFSSFYDAIHGAVTEIMRRKEQVFLGVDPIEDHRLWGFDPDLKREYNSRKLHRLHKSCIVTEFIIMSAMEFVLFHEYGHILLGHASFAEKTFGAAKIVEFEDTDGFSLYDTWRFYCEAQADLFAANNLALQFVWYPPPLTVAEALEEKGIEHSPFVLQTLGCLVALWVLVMARYVRSAAFLRRRSPKDAEEFFKQSDDYPSPIDRFHFVGNALRKSFPGVAREVCGVVDQIAKINPFFRPLLFGLLDDYKPNINYLDSTKRELADVNRLGSIDFNALMFQFR